MDGVMDEIIHPVETDDYFCDWHHSAYDRYYFFERMDHLRPV